MSDARIGIILPANWWLAYLGKPWAAVPNPPESYTCGELVRAVHLDLCGIDSPPIPVTNAGSRAQCLRAMQPDLFGLEPLALTIEPRALDVVFLGRRERFGHCGVAVETTEGLRVLHCPEAACGVTLDCVSRASRMRAGSGIGTWTPPCGRAGVCATERRGRGDDQH